MKPSKCRAILWLQALLCLAGPFLAVGGQGGTVHVGGYTKKDGTYVAPYDRRAPGTATPTTATPINPVATPPVRVPSDAEIEAAKKAVAAANLLSFHKAQAAKGDPQGQYAMGLRYLNGDGVPKYEEIGRDYLTKAAKQGHTNAYVTLKNRDYFETKRDENGRIIRSSTARHDFMKQTGYANGRPGYVVDHIIALKHGGCDCPENMQWQTIEEAKAKDKWE
jgi:hypothetical protein